MLGFSKLFEKADGLTIEYEGKILHWADKFPVSNDDILILSIEKTNSEDIQGVSISITGSCELNGQLWEKGKGVKMIFWEDATVFDPKHIELKVLTKKDFVLVQNIWATINEMGTRSVDSGRFGAAMIVEEIENGRRYRCNDWHPDENFDDIVFTVTKLK